MIEPIELRPGNYIHPGNNDGTEANTAIYMRVLSVDILKRKISAKEDHKKDVIVFETDRIFACGLEDLEKTIGGLAFGPHSILLKDGGVYIVHEEGNSIPLPHIRYVHQFQNLMRSLTGSEMPFNLSAVS